MNFEEFKSEYQKAPVEEYPNHVSYVPLVSISVVTYQHKNYIRDCLDGILMQKTDFPFEILLGEDASTDGTREICIKYAEQHPDIIRLFLHDRVNNIIINGSPTGRFNFLYNLYSLRGKYIALCEGDDYWTDPLKLQKQIDFLERNKKFSLCSHPYINFNYQAKESSSVKINRYMTLTMVFINNLPLNNMEFIRLLMKVPHCDSVIREIMKRQGLIKFIPDIKPAIRTVHEGGIATSVPRVKSLENSIKTHKAIMEFFADRKAVEYHQGKITLFKLKKLRLEKSIFTFVTKGICLVYNMKTLRYYLSIFYHGE